MKKIIFGAIAATLAIAPLTAQWGPISAPNQPPGRDGALMGYDLPGNRMLMFGGNWSNEFWALHNGAWTQLQPSVLPPSRSRADMAVDSIAGNVVLYGGDGGNRYALDDTWVFDGAVWSQATPAQSPGGLGRHSMAFDLVRQTTVLFGGRNDSWNNAVQSAWTWEFANGDWSLATPAAAPPARIDAAMSYHPGMNQVLMFGGEDGQGVAVDDTWAYDGSTWTQINVTTPYPTARAGARMVPVFSRGLCVLFGGVDPVTNQIFNDTWEHDGAHWRQAPATYGSVLPARHGFAMAHDIARDRIVLYGGKTQNSALRTDTWEYGAHWRRFGNGCAGSAGVPTFTGGALPQLGQTCDAQLTNLPPASSVALVAVGLSRQHWAFGSLPALLANFGMPYCRSYTSADALTAIPVTGGVGQWSWNVPAAMVFIGAEFHLQGLVLDPGVNAAGATVTNASTLVVGW